MKKNSGTPLVSLSDNYLLLENFTISQLTEVFDGPNKKILSADLVNGHVQLRYSNNSTDYIPPHWHVAKQENLIVLETHHNFLRSFSSEQIKDTLKPWIRLWKVDTEGRRISPIHLYELNKRHVVRIGHGTAHELLLDIGTVIINYSVPNFDNQDNFPCDPNNVSPSFSEEDDNGEEE